MKTLTTLCLVLCLVATSQAQNMIVGQHAIDDSRYEGTEKDPYLFKEFANATAINTKKGETVEYLLNYNGYTNEFEFIHNGVKSEMDANYYDVIEVSSYTPSEHYPEKYVSASVKFVKGIDPKSPNAFGIVVYEDENLVLFKKFSARINKKEFNDPARGIVKIEAFSPNFNYLMQVGSETVNLGLSKKKVVAKLDHSKVASFVKKNKMKIKDESELVKIVAYYSELRAAEASTSSPIASANN